MPHLTAGTILGGSTAQRETLGQLYAIQVASTIVLKNPEERRSILVGLGLDRAEATREQFFDVLDLVSKCV